VRGTVTVGEGTWALWFTALTLGHGRSGLGM